MSIKKYYEKVAHMELTKMSTFFKQRKDESNGRCGRIFRTNNKITNGKRSKRGSWPWQAALYYYETSKKGTKKVGYICGGSLISKR